MQPNHIESLLSLLSEGISGQWAHEQVSRIHSLDKSSSFSDYNRSSDHCAQAMREVGLEEVERIAFPADGKTKFGDWMMPIAWDAGEATLEIVSPSAKDAQRILAQRSRQPQCLAMWSAPTPPGGVECELLVLKEGTKAEVESLEIQGRIVFTPGHPAEIKALVARKGGVGIISDWLRAKDKRDAIQWINTWSDSPGGWAMHAHDSRLFGFTIPKRRGEFLRDLAIERKGEKVRLKARVDSRLYEGELHYVTGVIKGTGDGEVLAMAHIDEQGANDNASGAATLLEAARALIRQIADGTLPPPRRTLRFLLMPESYGVMVFAVRNLARLKKTLCALNVDGGAGDYDSEDSRLDIVIDPLCCRGKAGIMADGVLAAVAQTFYNGLIGRPDKWNIQKYTLAGDNFLCEPLIGIPHPWLDMGDGGDYWHNSEDTPDRVDPRSLHDLATVSAAYLYLMAQAAQGDLERLASETTASLPDDVRQLFGGLRPAVARDEGAGAIRPRREIVGALTLDGLPVAQWKVVRSSPRWWSPYLAAWWWATGEHSIAQIQELIRAEFGNVPGDLEGFFDFLQKRGYVHGEER